MEDVQPNKFLLQQWLPDLDIIVVLIHHNDPHCTTFRMNKAAVYRNPLQQVVYNSSINEARCATGYPGILTQSAWDG